MRGFALLAWHKNAKNLENLLNPAMLVCIRKLLMSAGFQRFSSFFSHHFVFTKLATSSIRVQ